MVAFNSCVRVNVKPLLVSVLRVKSPLAHTRRIETNNGFFVFKSRVLHTIAGLGFERLELKRQVSINKVTIPRSVSDSDYTIMRKVTMASRIRENISIKCVLGSIAGLLNWVMLTNVTVGRLLSKGVQNV